MEGETKGAVLLPVLDQGGACSPVPPMPGLDRERAVDLARVLKSVADPARLQIIALLRASASGELCACDFPSALGLSQPTVSHHLKVLAAAGLVERRQAGVWAHFRLVDDELARLADELLGGPTCSRRG
ncbi:MAG: hypothetical protein RLZ55_562 [Actinomycetota bacterium]|jgi:ArsR family transcriptional regulator